MKLLDVTLGIFLHGSFEKRLTDRSQKLQFERIVAVFVVEKDSVLFDDEEFIKLCEKVAVNHFVLLIWCIYFNFLSFIYFKFYFFYRYVSNIYI
jgi:hypothetical protein